MVRTIVNWVHLFAAVMWLGAIVHGFLGVERGVQGMRRIERSRVRRALSHAFSPVAWSAVTALVLTGAMRLHWHVEESYAALLASDWGRLLMAKWVVAAALIGIGAWLRYRLLPALGRTSGSAGQSLGVERTERMIAWCGRLGLWLTGALLLIVTML